MVSNLAKVAVGGPQVPWATLYGYGVSSFEYLHASGGEINGPLLYLGRPLMVSATSNILACNIVTGTFTLNLQTAVPTDITFIITPFTGSSSNAAVSIAQFTPGAGASNWGAASMIVHEVLAADPAFNNQSTVKVRFQNNGNFAANLGSNAKITLMCMTPKAP